MYTNNINIVTGNEKITFNGNHLIRYEDWYKNMFHIFANEIKEDLEDKDRGNYCTYIMGYLELELDNYGWHYTENSWLYIGQTGMDKFDNIRPGKEGRGYISQQVYKGIFEVGWNNVFREILIDGISKKKSVEYEKAIIEGVKNMIENKPGWEEVKCLNKNNGGLGKSGLHDSPSKETLEKMSESHKGKKYDYYKKYIALNGETKEVVESDTQRGISRKTGVRQPNVNISLNNGKKQMGWRFFGTNNEPVTCTKKIVFYDESTEEGRKMKEIMEKVKKFREEAEHLFEMEGM